MTILDPGPSRRSFLYRLGAMGAAPALAGGLGALGLAGAAPAEATDMPRASSDVAGSTGKTSVWSHEYWAQRGDVKLYMFRKRMHAPKPGEKPLPVLFLVHGSSISSRPSFDLTVPGHGEY